MRPSKLTWLPYFLLILGISLLLVALTPATRVRFHTVQEGVFSVKKLHPPSLYIGSSVPDILRAETFEWNLLQTDDAQSAGVTIDFAGPDEADSIWIYALVAPFPTITDDVSSRELLDFWHGASPGPFAGSPLRMAESTLRAVSAVWGQAAPGVVEIVSPDRLVDTLWAETPSWGIVPFEKLEPRLKVLSIDQNSPIHSDFEQGSYPLIAGFRSSDPSFVLSTTNRDPSKLTTVMLTGVTALVRATASKMERNGMTYPAQDIGDVLRGSDILHINNEVPFYSLCDVPDPFQVGLRFCSREKYLELLTSIDTDVVELTGDHFADYGEQAMRESLQIYANSSAA